MSAAAALPLTQAARPDIAAEIMAGLGLSLAQAARRIPPFRNGRPTAPSTIFRWMTDGVRLADGGTLRLESARVAGRRLTTEPALARFIAAQTPRQNTAPAPAARPGRAEAELDAIGI